MGSEIGMNQDVEIASAAGLVSDTEYVERPLTPDAPPDELNPYDCEFFYHRSKVDGIFVFNQSRFYYNEDSYDQIWTKPNGFWMSPEKAHGEDSVVYHDGRCGYSLGGPNVYKFAINKHRFHEAGKDFFPHVSRGEAAPILAIRSREDLLWFTKKYSSKNPFGFFPTSRCVRWREVQCFFGGIAFFYYPENIGDIVREKITNDPTFFYKILDGESICVWDMRLVIPVHNL